jgi:hypothetical protein
MGLRRVGGGERLIDRRMESRLGSSSTDSQVPEVCVCVTSLTVWYSCRQCSYYFLWHSEFCICGDWGGMISIIQIYIVCWGQMKFPQFLNMSRHLMGSLRAQWDACLHYFESRSLINGIRFFYLKTF